MSTLPKFSHIKILPFLSIFILLLSVGSAVFLVQQQQQVRVSAWNCTYYVFEVSQNGVVLARNGSIRDEPEQRANVYINGELTATLYVPALKAGHTATLGQVNLPPTSAFNWRVVGTKDCENSGGYEETPTPTVSVPTAIPPTPTIPPTCPLAKLGDIDCNGIIDIIDYQILSNNFGTNYSPADLDENGIVAVFDYQILSNNFGRT